MAQARTIVQGAASDDVSGPRIVVAIDYGTSNTGMYTSSKVAVKIVAVYLHLSKTC